MTTLEQKSSVGDIRQRFDNDVDRFSNIETGQTATIDAPLVMELITQAAFHSLKFDYIDQEDSPRPVTYQMDLLRKVGYNHVELLHKNSCFAAFGAIKAE